jgi:hypothetical protein
LCLARIKTTTVIRLSLYAAEAQVLAQFSDDHVEAAVPISQAEPLAWREWK